MIITLLYLILSLFDILLYLHFTKKKIQMVNARNCEFMKERMRNADSRRPKEF